MFLFPEEKEAQERIHMYIVKSEVSNIHEDKILYD